MAKKKKTGHKRKQFKFVYRIEPALRSGYRGALPYDQKRLPGDTVVLILRLCLRSATPLEKATENAVRIFCLAQQTTLTAVHGLCEDWLLDLDVGTQTFRLLQAAGYEGNIDDLWRTVMNTVKPSRASAGLKSGTSHSASNGKKKWIHFTNSGQSRKPGGHNS